MLTVDDLVQMPYPADLTEGGIAYALRELNYGAATYNRVRRMATSAAAEIAFRRHLSLCNIAFDIRPSLPMYEHNRHDVILHGQRCDLKSFFISYQKQIELIEETPQVLLSAPALVPSDVDAAEGHHNNDLYLFAFVLGTHSPAPNAAQTQYFLHIMPEQWRAPAHWNPLGGLTLKSEADVNVQVEICGEDAARGFLSRVVNLLPGKSLRLNDPFYSVTTLHLRGLPAARVGIYAGTHKTPHIIHAAEWDNVWVQGRKIILAGYLTRQEFRQKSHYMPPGAQTFQYAHTRVKNVFVPISALRPIRDLVSRTPA